MKTRKRAEEEAAGIINGDHNSMKRLKDAIFGSSNIPPSSETNQCVNDLIAEIFSVNHAASRHPPYAEMICKAIEELNEEEGSNEASISSYIKLEFRDQLPWAHETLLSHHLGRLCSRGGIVMTSSDGCYKLPTSKRKKNVDQLLPQKEGEIVKEVNIKKKKKKRRGRAKKVKEDLVVEKKKVSYGPKKRRGRPPKAKQEASPPPCGPWWTIARDKVHSINPQPKDE